MRPALLYSASLNLVIGFEMLSIPLLFGEPQGIAVFATYVYNVALNSVAPNFGVLGTFALMMLAVVAGLLLLQNRLLASAHRSGARRVGKGCVRTCKYRLSPVH